MISRAAILVLVCGTLAFFLHRESERGTFAGATRWVLARLRPGGAAAESRVVLVELRDRDLRTGQQTFDSWPPSPLDYALIFENLAARWKPSAVAVEPVLAWQTISSLDAATLAERVTLLPRATLGCLLTGDASISSETGAPPGLRPLPRVIGGVTAIPEFAGALSAPGDEARGSKPLGFTAITGLDPVTRDGSMVYVPLLARRGEEVYPSLVLRTLMSMAGVAEDGVVVEPGREITVGSVMRIPIDTAGRLGIFTTLGDDLARVDPGSLFLDPVENRTLLIRPGSGLGDPSGFSGSLCVLGDLTAAAAEWPDGSRRTPAEMIALAIDRCLRGEHIRDPGSVCRNGIWAGVIAVLIAFSGRRRRWIVFTAAAGLAVIALVTYGLLRVFDLWVSPFEPAILIGAGTLISALTGRADRVDGPTTGGANIRTAMDEKGTRGKDQNEDVPRTGPDNPESTPGTPGTAAEKAAEKIDDTTRQPGDESMDEAGDSGATVDEIEIESGGMSGRERRPDDSRNHAAPPPDESGGRRKEDGSDSREA